MRYNPDTFEPSPLWPRLSESLGNWWVLPLTGSFVAFPIVVLIGLIHHENPHYLSAWLEAHWKSCIGIYAALAWSGIEKKLDYINEDFWTYKQMMEQRVRALEKDHWERYVDSNPQIFPDPVAAKRGKLYTN